MADKVIETSVAVAPETKASPSPEALLKAAVTGSRETAGKPTVAAIAKLRGLKFGGLPNARSAGLAAAGLGVGILLGVGAMSASAPRADTSAALFAQIGAGLEAGRLDAARLNAEIGRVGEGVVGLREANETLRQQDKVRIAGLIERLGRIEQTLSAKIAAVGDRQDQIAREQSLKIAALSGQIDRQAPVATPAPAPAPVARPIQAEPAQTGSIVEAKPKPQAIETWAVREVYDGIAVLEDRKRRLVEVGIGDTVPGIGRVDTIERRGRAWTVVTKQGLITPQSW